MAWQSWGHSGGTNGNTGRGPLVELYLTGQHIEDTYLGLRVKNWFDHHLKGSGLDRARVRLLPRGTVTGGQPRVRQRAAAIGSGPARPLYLSVRRPAGGHEEDGPARGRPPGPTRGSARLRVHRGLRARGSGPPPGRPHGAVRHARHVRRLDHSRASKPLAIVGAPTLDVRFESPIVAPTQSVGPSRQLQVFAKLYDVEPDGSKTLVHKLISPVRVADVTQPVHMELPAVVHRVEAGHRLQLVLASTDAAYKNAYAVQPVTVRASPLAPAALSLPVVGRAATEGAVLCSPSSERWAGGTAVAPPWGHARHHHPFPGPPRRPHVRRLLHRRIVVLDGELETERHPDLLAAVPAVGRGPARRHQPVDQLPRRFGAGDARDPGYDAAGPQRRSTLALGLACSAGQFLLTAGANGKRFALPTPGSSCTRGRPASAARLSTSSSRPSPAVHRGDRARADRRAHRPAPGTDR